MSKTNFCANHFVGNNVKNFKPKITKAAEWRPTNGLIIFDSLFPHIEFGFRGRKVPVATFHVRKKEKILKRNKIDWFHRRIRHGKCWHSASRVKYLKCKESLFTFWMNWPRNWTSRKWESKEIQIDLFNFWWNFQLRGSNHWQIGQPNNVFVYGRLQQHRKWKDYKLFDFSHFLLKSFSEWRWN